MTAGTGETFRDAIDCLARQRLDGRLPCDRFVTRYDFADLPRALDDASQGRVVKAVSRKPSPAGQLEM